MKVSSLHGLPGLNVSGRSLGVPGPGPVPTQRGSVDQASNNVRETAAFARRVVCRTLTVVGGVAAGTALAWWLSTASASADVKTATDQQGSGVASVAEFQQFAAPVAGPVEQAVETVSEYLQDPPPPPKDPLRDLGEKVKDAAEQFRDRAEQGIQELPDCAAHLCLDQTPAHQYPADGYGRADLPTAPAPVPAVVTSATGVDLDAIAHRTAKDRAFADGMSRRGSPAPVTPSLPDLPSWPTPFAPVVPATPATGGHSCAGNAMDSHLLATLPWQDSTFNMVAGGLSATTAAATFGRPGAQPGVAPD